MYFLFEAITMTIRLLTGFLFGWKLRIILIFIVIDIFNFEEILLGDLLRVLLFF